MSGVSIRREREADAEQIAEVSVLGWRAGYRELLSSDVLAELDPAQRAQQRREGWRSREYAHVRGLVAEDAGRIIGFVNFGPYRHGRERGWHAVDPTAGGEVYALYVRPDSWGAGIGGALLDAAVADLVDLGLTPVRLWTLVGNARALRFYQAHGFAADGAQQTFAVGGVDLPELRLTLGADTSG